MPSHPLIDVRTISPKVVLDIRYATADNFAGQVVYEAPLCFVHRDIIEPLTNVQMALEDRGLGLKFFDGFRPLATQQLFWDLIQDDRYIANPAKGSRHTRGTAIDLTIIDGEGRELEMPSGFDDLSERAHRNRTDLAPHVAENAHLLESLMVEQDFLPLPTEWWHFDFHTYLQYPVLDIEFSALYTSS